MPEPSAGSPSDTPEQNRHQLGIAGFTAADGSRVELMGPGKSVSVSNQKTHSETVLPVSMLAWATINRPKTDHCSATAFATFCVLEVAALFGATVRQTGSPFISCDGGHAVGTMAAAYVARSVYHNCLDKATTVSLGCNGQSIAYTVPAGQQTQNAETFFDVLRDKLGS